MTKLVEIKREGDGWRYNRWWGRRITHTGLKEGEGLDADEVELFRTIDEELE